MSNVEVTTKARMFQTPEPVQKQREDARTQAGKLYALQKLIRNGSSVFHLVRAKPFVSASRLGIAFPELRGSARQKTARPKTR
jgi:hypothetical protein